MKLNPPCKDCTERHQACHRHCEAYIKWTAERKKTIEENRNPLSEYFIYRDNQFVHKHQNRWHDKKR